MALSAKKYGLKAKRLMPIRGELNDALGIFFDDRFEYKYEAISAQTHGFDLDEVWSITLSEMENLFTRKPEFFQKFDYEWARYRESYNYPHEAHLQLAALNCISDIDDNHPEASERNDVFVRVVPNSSARPHVRVVGDKKVIVLTRGYSSAVRGFLRLWMRGCALGGSKGGFDARSADEFREAFLNGAKIGGDKLELTARAYIGNLLQLHNNEFPFMDQSSVFDDSINDRNSWGLHFGALVSASDIFLLFHELAHILSSDYLSPTRSLENEISTDQGAASLCIVAAANKDTNAFHALAFGSVVYFYMETLRIHSLEVQSLIDGRRKISDGRMPGIEEVLERGAVFKSHILRHLGPFGKFHYDSHISWQRALQLPFDASRWALLGSVSKESAGRLDEFLTSGGSA